MYAGHSVVALEIKLPCCLKKKEKKKKKEEACPKYNATQETAIWYIQRIDSVLQH